MTFFNRYLAYYMIVCIVEISLLKLVGSDLTSWSGVIIGAFVVIAGWVGNYEERDKRSDVSRRSSLS